MNFFNLSYPRQSLMALVSMMYLLSDLIFTFVGNQSILAEKITAHRDSFFVDLLFDLVQITATDEADIHDLFELPETILHVLFYLLTSISLTFLGLVRVPSMSKRHILFIIQNIQYSFDNKNKLSMENQQDDELEQIIQHKIMKVNGEVGSKKYQRGKFLGKGKQYIIKGGFAKCYEGLNLQNKKMFAIKVIKKASLQKNRAKQKLLSEIKIHKTLHQAYIVEFDSVFEDSNFVYIILQLCINHVTLSEMVKKRKKLTPKETRYFMLQLISAVEYMHGNRVIHRDLKLGNIFLNSNMEMKVGDFGLAAKLQFSDQKKRTMCGTPNYIAPEIVEGSVGHSYEVDIWSMGVICYAFLFGRPPFETNEVKMTYKKIKTCEYTFPNTSVPQEAKDFIKKILQLDPKQRMTTKDMLCHPFLVNQDIPKTLSVEALTQIPVFKNQEQSPLARVKSVERLKPEDFGTKRKPQLNLNLNNINNNQGQQKIFEGMYSPRNAFNEQMAPSKSSMNGKEEHKINILAYLDYSKKYGLGYIINNKYYGVYFNDETLMSCDEKKENIYFVQNPTLKQENIQSYKADTLPKDRDFQKKYLLLERFIIHLNEEMEKMPQEKLKFQKDDKFIFVKQWLKTRHAIMFGLSNKLFQVNFFDNSQILLHTAQKTVLFTSKKGESTYQILSNILQTQDNEMARRIKYTKQILNSIKRKKDEKIEEPLAEK